MISMPKVRVLPSELANQIAAGEVVERPSSVAKELLENALDAGATRIELIVSGGGIKELTVIDDGAGMSADDARLSIERHATSKLRAFSDLDSLGSYGFRGEALPSIASVSHFELTTRDLTRDEASLVSVRGGKKASEKSVGSPVGTRVSVKDLFYNVPARLKFLRSTSTESGHVGEVFLSLALSRPEVTFILSRDGRTARQLSKVQSRKERVSQVLERTDLTEISGERGPLRIEAFLSGPESSRNGASGLRFLVNGRPIRDRALAQAVAQSYGPSLERGRYPTGVVYLDLPAHLVDINVHPQKLEVRFAEARAVFEALLGVLSKELDRAPRAAHSGPSPSGRSPSARPAFRPKVARDIPSPPRGRSESLPSPRQKAEPEPAAPLELRDSAPGLRQKLRYIAQLRRSYLLCESRDGLVIVDQERLAERVLCAKLYGDFCLGRARAQALLFPVSVTLPEPAAAVLTDFALPLHTFGIEIRPQSDTRVGVHCLPEALAHADPALILGVISEELLGSTSGETTPRGPSPAERFLRISMRFAELFCQKRGQALSQSEATSLLSAFDELDQNGEETSPLIHRVSFDELEDKRGLG